MPAFGRHCIRAITGHFGVNRRRSQISRWFPSLLFVLSLLAVFNARSILTSFGPGADPETLKVWNSLMQSLAWLSGAAVFNQLTRVVLWDSIVARAIGGPVPGVLKEITAVLVYLVVITCIVGLVFERSVTGFLAALGAGGVVLGFALRNLFADIFTGLAINIDRTFQIGDWVQINEGLAEPTVAQIREIGWRCSSLVTEEQMTVVVPNGMLGLERVINISRPIEPTRFELDVTVEYSVPDKRVKRVLLAALKSLRDQPGFDQSHEPVVMVKDTSSLGVEYRLRYWILPWNPGSPTTWQDRVLSAALHHLRSAGISLAYPKTDIYHAGMPERQVEGRSLEDEITLLSNVRMFEPLERQELELIVESLKRRVVPPGQVLVHVGDEGSSLFILIEGLLEVLVEQANELRRVADLSPGQFFGEMSLLTGERRSATVRTVTESVVYEIDKEPLVEIMDQRPELMDQLSIILAERQLLTRRAMEHHEQIKAPDEFDSFARQMLTRMRDFLSNSRLAQGQ